MGKALIPRSVNENSTTSSSGDSRKKTNAPATARQNSVEVRDSNGAANATSPSS